MEKINKELEHIKQDENGEEIVFEMKHKLDVLQWLFGFNGLFFGATATIISINEPLMIFNPIAWLFCCGGLMSYRYVFYHHKNRIYITNQGIGFERKNWFRMQKKFFRFGEVGLTIINRGAYITNEELFIFYPINHQTLKRLPLFAPKDYYKIMVQDEYYKSKEFFTFIRQKTKEALMANGIEINDEELKEKIQHLTFKDL